ncbi:DUF397 domain-containing protein [Nocardia sp. NPDC051030]|uniref:DUF397 domain-containing protein n=1 Tax=Nocardia sp. NPDC051030 TaxID=3155162 RepID=UPI00342B410A
MSASESALARTTGWFKSAHSDHGAACVEVRFDGDLVLIRDSKYLREPGNDPAAQPIIAVSVAAWDAFIAGVRAGEFSIARV